MATSPETPGARVRALVLADREPRPSVGALLAAGGFDVVLGLGDLQRSWVEALAGTDLPKFGVHGNHDDGTSMAEIGMQDLHLRAATVGGLTLAGFEGCVRYRPGRYQYTQAEATVLAAALPAADVLLCHCPPFGVNDDPEDPAHVGFHALRAWVERVQPRLVLHGHTHPTPGRMVRRLGATRVEFVSGARIVEL